MTEIIHTTEELKASQSCLCQCRAEAVSLAGASVPDAPPCSPCFSSARRDRSSRGPFRFCLVSSPFFSVRFCGDLSLCPCLCRSNSWPPPCLRCQVAVPAWAPRPSWRGRPPLLPPTGQGLGGGVTPRVARRVLPTDSIGGHCTAAAAPIGCLAGKRGRVQPASVGCGGGSLPAPQQPFHSPLCGGRRATASLARAGRA